MEKYGFINRSFKRMAVPVILLLLFAGCMQPDKKNIIMPTVKSIKGIAFDSSGMPIADASVMIVDGSAPFQDMAGISNEKGEFYLDNITLPGTYTVQIMWQGGTLQKTIAFKETDSIFTIRD